MVSLFDKLQCFLAILTTIALEAKLLEQASHSKKIHTAVIDHENPWTLAFYYRAQIDWLYDWSHRRELLIAFIASIALWLDFNLIIFSRIKIWLETFIVWVMLSNFNSYFWLFRLCLLHFHGEGDRGSLIQTFRKDTNSSLVHLHYPFTHIKVHLISIVVFLEGLRWVIYETFIIKVSIKLLLLIKCQPLASVNDIEM